MRGVTSGAIDDRVVGKVLAVVNEDGPDVDKYKEGKVCHLVEREKQGVEVVWERLGEAIDGVEGMAGVGSGHDPFVVRLVEALVDCWMVKTAVHPVDAQVREQDEEGELCPVVPAARAVLGPLVELAVSLDFEQKTGGGEDGHAWHGGGSLLNLEGNLILQKFGVLEGLLVKYEPV